MKEKIKKIFLWIILPPVIIMVTIIVFSLFNNFDSSKNSVKNTIPSKFVSESVSPTPTPTPFPPEFFEYHYSFEDFPVAEVYTGKPAKIDFSSHPDARTFRTVLKIGVKEMDYEYSDEFPGGRLKKDESANFAGHYVLLYWGCGTECQEIAIVDARNGKVYFPQISASLGVKYNVKSNLLIVNPPDEIKSRVDNEGWLPKGIHTKYYKWQNNKLIEIEDDGFGCGCEETFEKPIDVVWTGNVFAFMQSGEAFGIERTPKNEQYPVFFACCIEGKMENDKWIIDHIRGKVKITGKWTGITCAYKNTIFGRCVPDVDIEKIEELE